MTAATTAAFTKCGGKADRGQKALLRDFHDDQQHDWGKHTDNEKNYPQDFSGIDHSG